MGAVSLGRTALRSRHLARAFDSADGVGLYEILFRVRRTQGGCKSSVVVDLFQTIAQLQVCGGKIQAVFTRPNQILFRNQFPLLFQTSDNGTENFRWRVTMQMQRSKRSTREPTRL